MTTYSRLGVRDETGGTWPACFPLFGAGIGANSSQNNVPFAERLVSSFI